MSPGDEEDEEGGLALFTLVGRKAASKTVPLLVPARGAADDAALVAEPQTEARAQTVARSAWEGRDEQEEEREDSRVAGPGVPPALEEVVVAGEGDGNAAEKEAEEDAEAQHVSLFSHRVVASRTRYKRHREPVVAARDRDRAQLSLLCVTAKDLHAAESAAVADAESVAALLPAAAVVVPDRGEQPPSPDPPRSLYQPPAPTHRRWVFDESGREQAEAAVSRRQRKRHPGELRKARSAVPEVRLVELPVEQERPPSPQRQPARVQLPPVDAVAAARARKSAKTNVPKNLLLAQ